MRKKRKNLKIYTNVLISKVLFKNKDAIGVSGVRNGKEINFYANNEVILCAGSFQSSE